MHSSEIVDFLIASDLPYQYLLPDTEEEVEYLGAARLRGGAYLPCVAFRDQEEYLRKALQYLEKLRRQFGRGAQPYQSMLEFYINGGRDAKVFFYDIASIEKSVHAIPPTIYNQLDGPTGRNGMCFVAEMKDGKCFAYHDEILMESFWDMPSGYSGEDIAKLWTHSYLSKSGEIIPHGEGDADIPDDAYLAYCADHANELGAVPHFVCLVEQLSATFKKRKK